MSIVFGSILLGCFSHTTAYLLCDNDITNKPELSPDSVNCTKSISENLNTEVAVMAAIFSRRTLSLDGFGYKCSGYFIQSEPQNNKQHVVSLNLTELECKIMALIHTFTTESGRKLALLCNSHATRCLFKDDDESRSNQTASKNNKRRYFLMMTRVELKSNSRGHLVHREEVFDECHVEDKSCRVDGTLYVWDSNIIQSDGLVLLDHGLYVHSQAGRLIYTSSNENTTTSAMFLFFITDEFIKLDSNRYWLTSSGLYVLMRNDSEDGRFESIVDESRIRSNVGVVVGLNQLEMERLNDAKQAYQLFMSLRGSINRNEEEHERHKCILYQNQLNIMSASTVNNYFKFEMLDGTQVYVYVVNGHMYVTSCEPLLSVSEAAIETQEGEDGHECFKYRPVAVYDMKFNRFQAYLFNSLYVNSHPDKIACL